MKKVAIDMRMVNHSGIGTFLKSVVPSILRTRTDLSFVLFGGDQYTCREFYLPHVSLIRFNEPIYSIQEQLHFARFLEQDFSLIWSPHYNIPLIHRGRLLVTIHDTFHLSMSAFVQGYLRKSYARLMFNAVGRNANAIHCISNFTKCELDNHIRINDKCIVRVVHLGTPNKRSRDESDAESPHTKPYFVCVGNVKPHKNIPRLLRAFSSIMDDVDHDLIVVGKMNGFITGDEEATKLETKLADRVHFAGFVSDEDLARYISHADALVFPSLYEGFGLPPLEAMSLGRAVVASRIPAVQEVCGNSVLYFDPYDETDMASKMKLILTDEDLRRQLIQRGEETSRNYSWDNCVGHISQMIDEVLQL